MMTTFENKQQVKLLALSKDQDGSGSSKHPSYRYIEFLNVHGKKCRLFIESKLTTSLPRLKDFLVENDFSPNEVDRHGKEIKGILAADTARYFHFVMKPGYAGNGYINGDGTFIGKERGVGKRFIGNYLYPKANFQEPNQSQSGTLEGWKKRVAPRAKYSPPLMLSLCAALSGYILHFTDVESGGFHFHGDSSIGKSTCLKFAVSVYGSPDKVNSWSGTEAGFEEIAAGHSDSTLILDELNLLDKDPRAGAQKAMTLVYSITSEQGKKRSRVYDDGPISWKVSLLSSGENSLSEHAYAGGREQNKGEAVRLVDVSADVGNDFGIYEKLPKRCKGCSAVMADRTNRACDKNYGTAKDVFIDYLLTHISPKGDAMKLRRHISTFMKHFLAAHSAYNLSGQRLRIAKRFALAYAAGALAVKAEVLPFSNDEVMHGISTCFKESIEKQPLSMGQLVTQAKKELGEYLLKALGSSSFYKDLSAEEAKQTPYYRTSIKNHEVLALKSQSLHEFVSDDEVRKVLLKECVKKGILLPSRDKKPTRQPPSGKSGVVLSRRYCFLIDELNKLTS